MSEIRKPCLRCLLREMPGAEALREILRELIGQIPEEERTPAAEVQKRLAVCRECEHLHQGTCELCGCYVEHRAERKKADCPDRPDRWKVSSGASC